MEQNQLALVAVDAIKPPHVSVPEPPKTEPEAKADVSAEAASDRKESEKEHVPTQVRASVLQCCRISYCF